MCDKGVVERVRWIGSLVGSDVGGRHSPTRVAFPDSPIIRGHPMIMVFVTGTEEEMVADGIYGLASAAPVHLILCRITHRT